MEEPAKATAPTDPWVAALSTEERLAALEAGTRMVKVPSKLSSKARERLVRLDRAHGLVTWESKKTAVQLSTVALASIKEVRAGQQTKTFQLRGAAPELEARALSVIYVAQGRYKTLDLVAATRRDFELWYFGLLGLLQLDRERCDDPEGTSLGEEVSQQLKVLWRDADTNRDDGLDLGEVTALLRTLNLDISKTGLKPLFKQFDASRVGVLTFEQFEQLFLVVRFRPEISGLFSRLAGDAGVILFEVFERFVRDEQKMVVADEKVASWFQKYAVGGDGALGLSLSAFTSFLLSPHNQIFARDHASVYMDMDRPMHDYFIATSHNTYLLGDQLTGESSVEAYIRVLQRGCRCVELDTWDGPGGEPIIYHGRTLTSRITFRSVVAAIARYAFVSSPYPLVLSLENHCSVEQQAAMAAILVETLGDMLLCEPVAAAGGAMPSPEALRGRVLVKAKRAVVSAVASPAAPAVLRSAGSSRSASESASEGSNSEDDTASVLLLDDPPLVARVEKPVNPQAPARKKRYLPSLASFSGSTDATVQHQSRRQGGHADSANLSSANVAAPSSAGAATPTTPAAPAKKRPQHVAAELSALVIYFAAKHFDGLEQMLRAPPPPGQVTSLSERKAKVLFNKSAAQFQRLNACSFTRVYPAGMRVKSSNYEPHWMWLCGCQLVALNYQTHDKGLQINTAMFAGNGGCGYILKPAALREVASVEKQRAEKPAAVSVTVISAQQLPKPRGAQSGEIIDPYVEVDLVGPERDQALFRTNVVANNGFSPVWNATATFTATQPELSFLRFAVYDMEVTARDQIVAWYAVALRDLAEGYRHVPLYDWRGERLRHATLFVRVVRTPLSDAIARGDPVVDSLVDSLAGDMTNLWAPRVERETLASDELLRSVPPHSPPLHSATSLIGRLNPLKHFSGGSRG